MDNMISYADIIGHISVSNGMVRIDLLNEPPQGIAGVQEQNGDSAPQYVFSRRLVMPLMGFVQSYPLLQDVMDQLQEKGAIQITPKADAK